MLFLQSLLIKIKSHGNDSWFEDCVLCAVMSIRHWQGQKMSQGGDMTPNAEEGLQSCSCNKGLAEVGHKWSICYFYVRSDHQHGAADVPGRPI